MEMYVLAANQGFQAELGRGECRRPRGHLQLAGFAVNSMASRSCRCGGCPCKALCVWRMSHIALCFDSLLTLHRFIDGAMHWVPTFNFQLWTWHVDQARLCQGRCTSSQLPKPGAIDIAVRC